MRRRGPERKQRGGASENSALHVFDEKLQLDVHRYDEDDEDGVPLGLGFV